MYHYKKSGVRTRLVCTSAAAQRAVWPVSFSYCTPSALPLAQWAARGGALVHPGLRLVEISTQKGLGVISLRRLPAGTPLMILPNRIAMTTALEDRQSLYLGQESPMEQLYFMIAKGIVDDNSPWKVYLEFLHDIALTQYEKRMQASAAHGSNNETQLHSEDDFLSQRPELQREVDRLLGGNAVRMIGVPNAPFLEKRSLKTPRSRVAWVRWHQAKRTLQQSLPHFSSQAAGWAISVALSRSMAAPGSATDSGELRLVPLLDMLNHSPTKPNAHIITVDPSAAALMLNKEKRSVGVGAQESRTTTSRPLPPISLYGGCLATEAMTRCFDKLPPFEWDELPDEPRTILVTVRDMQPGEEVLVKYSDLGGDAVDEELWRMRWGFCASPSNSAAAEGEGALRRRRRQRKGTRAAPPISLVELDASVLNNFRGIR